MAVFGGDMSRGLFARECVPCPSVTPACPSCPTGSKCSISVQTCDTCQSTSCIVDPTVVTPANPDTSTVGGGDSSPNVGAIAGGVIGGLAAIAIVVYLVWRFFVKNRRAQYEEEYAEQYTNQATDSEKDFASRRDARASTHTVGSIASTVLTRASNIIQIAYIPGVTNRSAPSTPGLLVPPVPPIPIALSGAGTPSYEDEHFFMPGDLRDSTYSAMTDRTSYAPRSSVASTIYGKNAVLSPLPAQTVMRGKAAVISVKSNGGHSPGELTPPVPNVDYTRYKNNNMQPPPSPAFSVGSTFLNSASAATATQIKPTMVKVIQKKINKPKSTTAESSETEAQENDASRESAAITIIDDTPTVEQGPFSDPSPAASSPKTKGHVKKGSLSAVIEEAQSKKAQSEASAKEEAKKKDETPFGDEHATD
ncbi:hypothetical protein V499_07147 [Pseudogymnoascus sp. VKM F-103]|uniref:Membrane anchor Opy2 N-terminal domain-containing protein n=1 Tax=Pseudogymnoascus verrucosus TaxID=342668 RepID=A0A1B8GN63_9PEZI|nr:uncharacterized protein VE01_04659 [Pseudogymnoascus verrucosus]KFY72726.1 hypothetical protein V499_07147 [Pseudogymnoascus sp. VKM F-103]OBT97280.1 hypothetical protein VE01_04659 [Pseudogymnoascus verrucosus]